MSEEKENIIEKLNKSLVDLVAKVFGDSGKDFIEKTQEKVKDFSSQSVKKFMEFTDSILTKLNLSENDQVVKAKDTIEDLLKQAGFLKDQHEEDDF
ncbi:MAG: hypothetical protein KGD63_06990 [Candidatus Lokiarchaeota archaeon]|nr:hypothetical protein [Candidatus Lokiarchaeota archaeon]